MITFGKYKNKTFEYVLKNDLSYCNWCLKQSSSSKHMNEFIFFLKNNKNNIIPKDSINCSSLSEYYESNNLFLDYIKDLKIEEKKINNIIINDITLPADINGVYIDYMIRYKICCFLQKDFFDSRCDFFVQGSNMCLNVEEIKKIQSCVSLNVEDYIDEDFDDEANINSLNCCMHRAIREIVKKSYNNMKNFIASDNDVLNVSLCHFLFFAERDAYNYFNFFINKNDSSYNNCNLENYIQEKINEKKDKVICNPALGNKELKIGGDADLIIDEELLDFKCSKNYIGENINDFIQLFLYICLYFMQTGIKIKKISILNPILNYEKFINLNNWNHYDKIISLLKNRVNVN
jgi:hypothetical protein